MIRKRRNLQALLCGGTGAGKRGRRERMKRVVRYLFFPAASLAVGGLAAWLSAEGIKAYQNAVKPPLAPPDAVFPIVWTILYLLMGVGMAMVVGREGGGGTALLLWALQLAANFVWTLIFFRQQDYLLALIWLVFLWALILAMTIAFRRADPLAALLQVPYLLWVAFAGYLNYMVWVLNP